MEITQIIYIILITFLIVIAKKVFNFTSLLTKLSKKTKYEETDIKARFSKDSIPSKIDYIVIGAGTSGLASAAVLSKLGYKVLVLEQIGKAGGTMHTFKKKDFEFDTGLHYLGNSKNLRKMFNYISSKPIEWNNYDHFDTIKLGKKSYKFSAPSNKFFSDLIEKFPQEKQAIEQYRILSQRGVKLYDWMTIYLFLPFILQILAEYILRKLFSDIYAKSTLQIFDEIGISKNKELAFLLSVNVSQGLAATQENIPFVLHANFMAHYHQSGQIYPKGGSRSIVESIVSTIVSRGGKLMTKAKVEQIVVKENKVQGVEVNGTFIKCPNVISTVGIPTTTDILPESERNKLDCPYFSYENKVQKKQGSDFNTFYMFYGIDAKDVQKPGTENTWVVPDSYEKAANYDSFVTSYDKSQNLSDMINFISFPYTKSDPNSELINVTQIGLAQRNMVEKYQIVGMKSRKEGYKEYKEEVEQEMTKVFLKQFPQYEDKIVVKLLGTPLTVENYFGRKLPFGIPMDTQKIFDLGHFRQTQTNIYGLHVTGQDFCHSGIIGALSMGYICALRATYYI